MPRSYTTIEQSKKLIALGIDKRTADLLWTYDDLAGRPCALNFIQKLLQPEPCDVVAWSTDALLDYIPKFIIYHHSILAYPDILRDEDGNYSLSHYDKKTDFHEELIDAVYEMVEWLLENKVI